MVGAIVLLAVAGSALARRRSPRLAEGEHNEMVGVVLGMFGAIYGIILAFVVVTLWTQLDHTRTVVSQEATDMQWPKMRAGHPSFEATSPQVGGMYDALQAYDPKTARDQAFYEEAVTRLNDAAAMRRERINIATIELPVLLQVLVYGGALVIILLTSLYGLRSLKMQFLFVASVAGLIGFSLLLVLVLDRPFAGDLTVSPEPFKESSLSPFWPRGGPGSP
ncbi:bestrophin-like domain [Streptomyces sp. NPDC003952]